jgi:AraC-like DNA-binding protein
MNRPRKIPDLPNVARPKWASTDRRGDLDYLGWGLRSYGRHPTTPSTSDTWSYSLILRGTPTILLSDGPHRLAPNHAALVAPPRLYEFGFRDEPNAVAEVLIWTWRTPPLLSEIQPPASGYLLFHLDAKAKERVKAVHAACRREVASPDQFTARLLRGYRMQLETELARQLTGQASMTDRKRMIELAVGWMGQHLECAHPVFLLCDYLQVARSTLDKLFHDAFGESPSGYHRRLRMEKARELLEAGKPVKEVAFHLGYKHANDFSRAFRAFREARARAR